MFVAVDAGDLLAVFKASKGMKGKGEGKGKGDVKIREGREGRERGEERICRTNVKLLPTRLVMINEAYMRRS